MPSVQDAPDLSAVLLTVRVSAPANSAYVKESDPAFGRRRDNLCPCTKMRGLADWKRRSPCLRVTGGKRHDRNWIQFLATSWMDTPLPFLIARL